MVQYTVRCEFIDQAVSERWVNWLRDEHIQDVIDAGATSGEVLRMDGDAIVYEVRYCFPERGAFDRYIAEYAPTLRDDGLAKFPLALGLKYSRTVGESLLRIPDGLEDSGS